MEDVVRSQQNTYEKDNILALPPGPNLGVHFSKTVPCEICRIDEESPIFSSSLQFIGRIAFQLLIPNKIEIYGALDHETLMAILTAYSNIPNRMLTFKNRKEVCKHGLVTTTVLQKGPIFSASFRSSRGVFKSLNRIFVEKTNIQYEFPLGHFVAKVIIPDQVVIENGIQTPELLFKTLDHFSETPGRKIVFQKEYPRGGTVTSVTLPRGPTGLLFFSDYDDTSSLPVISTVLSGSSAWRLNVPVNHVLKKLIIPNEMTIERMGFATVEAVLNDYSEVDGRIIVLQELIRDISRAGATVTVTLPTGKLGVTFKSIRDELWIEEVNANSQLLGKVPCGFYVESLVIPDELELIGKDELKNATYLSEKLNESTHISHRILVLQQDIKDVKKRSIGTRFSPEFV